MSIADRAYKAATTINELVNEIDILKQRVTDRDAKIRDLVGMYEARSQTIDRMQRQLNESAKPLKYGVAEVSVRLPSGICAALQIDTISTNSDGDFVVTVRG